MNRVTGLLLLFVSAVAIAASPVPYRAGAQATTMIPFGQGGGGPMLEAAVYPPRGDQRAPLAIVSHGSPRSADDRRRMSTDFRGLTTWLVDHGFAVIVPMRRGYGQSGGAWVEGFGSCDNADYVQSGLTSADDVDAAVRYAREQPFADAARIVLIGQSAGGFASLAEASRNPEGVIAVVNFAGGRGSQRPNFVCAPERLVGAMGLFGKTTTVPTLWIYSANDHFFGPEIARRMFAAFSAGSPKAEFVAAPASGNDGHNLVHTTGWEPYVEAFLKRVVPGP